MTPGCAASNSSSVLHRLVVDLKDGVADGEALVGGRLFGIDVLDQQAVAIRIGHQRHADARGLGSRLAAAGGGWSVLATGVGLVERVER